MACNIVSLLFLLCSSDGVIFHQWFIHLTVVLSLRFCLFIEFHEQSNFANCVIRPACDDIYV